MKMLQLTNSQQWEQVDDYVFANRESAVDADGEPRYTGSYVSLSGGEIDINATIDKRTLAIINRLVGVSDKDCPNNGPFLREPEFVRMIQRKKMVLHEINGGTFVQKK